MFLLYTAETKSGGYLGTEKRSIKTIRLKRSFTSCFETLRYEISDVCLPRSSNCRTKECILGISVEEYCSSTLMLKYKKCSKIVHFERRRSSKLPRLGFPSNNLSICGTYRYTT